MLQRQIDRIAFVDEDSYLYRGKDGGDLALEERAQMDEFRKKLVGELEDFNKNIDERLKEQGELHIEEESNGEIRQVDLEREGAGKGAPDVFTRSFSQGSAQRLTGGAGGPLTVPEKDEKA